MKGESSLFLTKISFQNPPKINHLFGKSANQNFGQLPKQRNIFSIFNYLYLAEYLSNFHNFNNS